MEEDNRSIHCFESATRATQERVKLHIENKDNKATLEKYLRHLQDRGLATGTIYKNYLDAYYFAEFAERLGKKFKDINKDDIDKWLEETRKGRLDEIGRGRRKTNGDYIAPSTATKKITCLKAFYAWHYKLGRGKYPEQVDWLRPFKMSKPKNLAQDIISPKEIKRAIQAAHTPRNRFFVSLIFDVGARISELGALNIEDIEEKNDERGGYLVIHLPQSKTQPRTIAVRNSRPYLIEYLRVIPVKNPSAPLFQREDGKRLRYDAFREMLEKAINTASIAKPCNLHHPRHCTASIYGKFFTEGELNKWFGWGKQHMSSRYISLSGEDLLACYDKFWVSDLNVLRQITCKCGHANLGVLEYCAKCKQPLLAKTVLTKDTEETIRVDALMEKLSRNPEFLTMLGQFMEKNKLKA